MQDYNYLLLLITTTAIPIITRAAIAPTNASISTLDMPLDGVLAVALDVYVMVCGYRRGKINEMPGRP